MRRRGSGGLEWGERWFRTATADHFLPGRETFMDLMRFFL